MKKSTVQNQTPSRLPLPILLVLWVLFKLGSLPIQIIFSLIHGVQYMRENMEIPTYQFEPKKRYHRPAFSLPTVSLPTVSLPSLSLPSFSLNISLPHKKKVAAKRGRPALKKVSPSKQFSFPAIKLPTISLPNFGNILQKEIPLPEIHKPSIHITLPKLRKDRRGRPRTQPFFQFYGRKLRKFIDRIYPKPMRWATVIVIVAGLVFGYSYFLINIAHSLPSPDNLTYAPQPKTTEIYDRNNKLLYQIYEDQNRKLVKLDQIPAHLLNATVAIEDKNFFTHPGVDLVGITRAFRENLAHHDIQGGSTITQQLIKNTLLSPDQTYQRKIKEVLLAFWAERVFTKQQILQMYFNEIAYGGTAWGAEAGAQTYFGKSVSQLDLAESAYLAGLPAAPSDYSPFGSSPQKGRERQELVLRRMVEDGYINQSQADEALQEKLTFLPPHHDIKAPHFVMYIRQQLVNRYGERTVAQGGLRVVTTLDYNVQQMAESIVSREVNKLANLRVGNGAAMITDAKTGQILAMVGSKNYFDPKGGNFNVALALRQPGSSFKPITYITGFKQGFSPGSVLLDTPTTFVNPYGSSYSPVNYDGKFHGAVTIRTALGSSYNIPAVKMLAIAGVPNVIQTAEDLGITTLTDVNNYGLSLTLGGGAVPMIEMMSAYNTFSQNGVRYPVTGIQTIVDSNGTVLEDNTHPEGTQAVSPELAYLITNVLADNNARVPAFGPRSLLELPGKTVAVKTGTSDDKRDNWTFGYTPEFVVGTWVGNNDNSPMDPALTSGITGASQIWHDLMLGLIADRPNLAFAKPAGVVEAVVDGHKDLIAANQSQRSAVAVNKNTQKEATSGATRETITYSDSFSWGVMPQKPR